MPEIARLSGSNDAIGLDFVEREATPTEMMELAIHLHPAGLSLSNTVSGLDNFGVSRARSTVHNWVQKADLEPRGGRDPEQIALDETVVKVNGERFWFVAAVEPETVAEARKPEPGLKRQEMLSDFDDGDESQKPENPNRD